MKPEKYIANIHSMTEALLPTVEISSNPADKEYKNALLRAADLSKYKSITEVWNLDYSSKELSYLTHGLFRFYGKFPPPVARHLIQIYSKKDQNILDPTIGSGTTAVESIYLNRNIFCADVSPLSALLAKVKCTPIKKDNFIKALDSVKLSYKRKRGGGKIRISDILIPEKSLFHWFLPETVTNLRRLLSCVLEIKDRDMREALLLSFLSILRRVSKATSQQGRLFLDVETAEEEPWDFFEKAAIKSIGAISRLPKHFKAPSFELRDLRSLDIANKDISLVICHPPYFNVYKFSTIFSLELGWLSCDRKDISKKEIREFFKVGKPGNVDAYVADLGDGIKNLSKQLRKGAVIALMMGDTKIHDKHIPTTKLLLDYLSKDPLSLIKIAIRKPKYTEASWVTSQRRNAKKIGISLSDFILIFKKL